MKLRIAATIAVATLAFLMLFPILRLMWHIYRASHA